MHDGCGCGCGCGCDIDAAVVVDNCGEAVAHVVAYVVAHAVAHVDIDNEDSLGPCR